MDNLERPDTGISRAAINVRFGKCHQQLAGHSDYFSREAARKITDGTENPSPPGESRLLIAKEGTLRISGCQ